MNFVIALVNQSYTEIMDSRTKFQYKLKQDLNDECETFNKFINSVYLKFRGERLKDEPINIAILINTKHQSEEGSEW